MKTSIQERMKSLMKKHDRHKRWKKVIISVAAVVVFITVYALVMPAITLERNTVCGMEEHKHSGECYKKTLVCGKSDEVPTKTEKVLECQAEIHKHGKSCYDKDNNLTCGYADYVIHEHDKNCYDEDGNLVCPLPEIKEHTHKSSCYKETKRLICGKEEGESADGGEVHKHDDSCYEVVREYTCGKTGNVLHKHTKKCYDGDSLVCGMLEVTEHVHSDKCFKTVTVEDADAEQHVHTDECYEEKLVCGKEEHSHTSECYVQPDDGDAADDSEDKAQEEEAQEEEDSVADKIFKGGTDSDEQSDDILDQTDQVYDPDSITVAEADANEIVPYAMMKNRGEYPVMDDDNALAGSYEEDYAVVVQSDSEGPGNIAEHLTSAEILAGGEVYDGTSLLNPEDEFKIKLQWHLERADFNNGETMTFTYRIPEQITVEDVEETILYDVENPTVRKGVYSIKDGLLTVKYDEVSDESNTTFDLQARWNIGENEDETRIEWGNDLKTDVSFGKAKIAATKTLEETRTESDGSLVGIYAVKVKADGRVENITLEDTLESEHFHFYKEYFNGKDYECTVTDVTGNKLSGYPVYGNFPEGIFKEDGTAANEKTNITFPEFNLNEGETYTVRYAVKLDADVRLELDEWQKATNMTNTAKASYQSGKNELSSSVTVQQDYRADEKWVVKSQPDFENDPNAPWTVVVNGARDYDMSGALIADALQTKGAEYKTDQPMRITCTTGEEGDVTSQDISVKWITLGTYGDQELIDLIASVGGEAIEKLFESDGATALAKINEAIKPDAPITKESKERLSNYVFVNGDKNKFIWFAKEVKDGGKIEPTTYTLSYNTDTSKVASSVVSNSACAGWKRWISGDTVGSFLQEVGITKENTGVYQEDGKYLVDWDIKLKVEADRNEIPDVYLYDILPSHKVNEQGLMESDWLDGINLTDGGLDLSKWARDPITYMNQLTRDAFRITVDSQDEEIKTEVENQIRTAARTSFGNPVTGVPEYELYSEGTDVVSGQLAVVNVPEGDDYEKFKDKRFTAKAFGVWLGNLPGTKDKNEGYTITVHYTTQVPPALINDLDGRDTGYNYVALCQHNTVGDAKLADASSGYYVTHTKAQNMLDKSVANFDSTNRILTYEVQINPDKNLTATNCSYILNDTLDLPGAKYISESFQLSFPGKVEFDGNKYNLSLVDEGEMLLWANDKQLWSLWENKYKELFTCTGTSVQDVLVVIGHMGSAVDLTVNEADGGNNSEGFTLTINDSAEILKLAAPEASAGKLIPMTLTYQVQLPEDTTLTKDDIRNTINLSRKVGDNNPEQLDSDSAKFDYSSALYKRLAVTPNANNGYTASFMINVDKTAKGWKDTSSFTISDEMSKSLEVDIDSIKVYGIGQDDSKTKLTSGYTPSYDNYNDDEQNFLSVTITDQTYTRYRIEYDANILGDAGKTIEYDNAAKVMGTDIESNKVEKSVHIQKQSAGVDSTTFKIDLQKFDGDNTNIKLEATFDIYVYENGNWVKKYEDLKTNKNGRLELNNEKYPGLLSRNTWYKLEETEPPQGYSTIVTYFCTGSAGDEKPSDVNNYKTISITGGSLLIPNYKLSLQLRKVNSANNDIHLSGAEFGLYDNNGCTGDPVRTSREMPGGLYKFELDGLDAGKTYYLKETKAPAGYKLSAEIYTVTFIDGAAELKDSKGEDVAKETIGTTPYLIGNEVSYKLPETGGLGIILYTMAGIVFVTVAGFMYRKELRKRRIRVRMQNKRRRGR